MTGPLDVSGETEENQFNPQQAENALILLTFLVSVFETDHIQHMMTVK